MENRKDRWMILFFFKLNIREPQGFDLEETNVQTQVLLSPVGASIRPCIGVTLNVYPNVSPNIRITTHGLAWTKYLHTKSTF